MSDPQYYSSSFGHQNNQNSNRHFQSHQGHPKDRMVSGGPVMSSRRKARMKQSKIRRNILIAVSIIIGIVLALIASDTIKIGKGPQPYFGDDPQAAKQLPVEVAGIDATQLRTPTQDAPLRVFIGGDSLAGSYGYELAAALGDTGVIEPVYDSRPSSGLSNSDFFDWENHARRIVERYNPELVALSLGTNDASIVTTDSNYKNNYASLIKNIIDIFDAEKRTLYFVLAPAMKNEDLNEDIIELNKIILETASENNAKVIQMAQVLSPENVFVRSINIGNKTQVIRSSDGIHIADTGSSMVAKLIYAEFSKIIDLPSKKLEPIKPIKARA